MKETVVELYENISQRRCNIQEEGQASSGVNRGSNI